MYHNPSIPEHSPKPQQNWQTSFKNNFHSIKSNHIFRSMASLHRKTYLVYTTQMLTNIVSECFFRLYHYEPGSHDVTITNQMRSELSLSILLLPLATVCNIFPISSAILSFDASLTSDAFTIATLPYTQVATIWSNSFPSTAPGKIYQHTALFNSQLKQIYTDSN